MRFLHCLPALLLLALAPLHAEDTQGLVFPIKIVSISSPVVVQEVIEAIEVEEGHQVTPGQVLVQLRSAKEKLTVREYERALEATEFTYKGAKALFDQKMGSKDQMLKTQTEWERAKIQLALANEQLKERTIRAPLAGIVVKKYKEAGESVDRGEKLVDIVNIDQVFVQFYLDPKLMLVLKEEQPITVRIAVLNDLPFAGKINFIDPRIDASSGLFRIKVLIENPDHKIKSGMRALADFSKNLPARPLVGPAPPRPEDTQGLVFPIKIVSISSPVVVQEVIEAIEVEEGNQVTEGQVLVQLRSAKEQLTVKEYERVVEATEFAYKGAKALYDQKMGSKEQMLKTQTEWERAKIQLALANEQLKERTIRAPLAGIVVKKYKEAGESVDRGEKLVDIVNIDQVFVQFYLDPKLMQVLKEEQPITVRIAVLNDLQFTGKINFIDPRIDASSGLFRIKVLIENPDRKIKAGMRALADFSRKK